MTSYRENSANGARDPIRILHVDDSAHDRELVRDALENADRTYSLIGVATHAELLRQLDEGSFDLILSDFNILGFEGFDVMDAVNALRSPPPVVIVTGTGSEETAVEALKRGAKDYVVKTPERIKRLPVTIETVLESTHLREARRRAHEELGRAKEQLERIVTQNVDGMVIIDDEGEIVFANPAAAKVLNRDPKTLVGASLGAPIVSDDPVELDILHLGAAPTCVELRATEVEWNGRTATLAALRDVTGLKRSAEQISQLNRILRAIRNVNQLIVREKDPARLIQQACDVLTETRGYIGAWIAVGDDRDPQVLVAQAGWGDAFEPLAASLQKGRWPPCRETCVACEEVAVICDPKGVCEGCSLADAYGDRTALATALRHDGQVLGQLNVSVPGRAATDEEERLLLAEVAADIAFALHKIEAERLRRESEERFKVITESSPDAIFVGDRMGNCTYANEATEQLLGYSTDELVQMSIIDLAARERAQEFLQVFQELLVKGRLFIELELVRKDGTVIPVDLNAVLLPTGETYASCRDLTSRKQAEEELRKSSAQLKLAQQVAHIGHWELDAYDGTPVWSDEVFRIFGLEPGTAEPSFTSHATIIHPEEWPLLDEAVRAGFETGAPFDLDFRILRPGQELGWMQAIGSATRDDTGRVVKMFGTAQDITERRQAEVNQREAEELFQLSFEHASIGKSLTLPDGTLGQVNQALCDLLGYTREELQAKGFAEVTHPDDLASSREAVRCLLAGEQSQYRIQKRYLRSDGQAVWADVSTLLLRREDGSPRCFITHILDISDRKEFEDALRESQQLLEGILDSIPARVFWKDRNLVYLGSNAAFAHDAGFASPQDVIGRDDYQMPWHDQAESYRSNDREVIEHGVTKLLFEEPQTTPTGNTITLLTSKLPLRSATGEITGVLGTYLDITEIKQLQGQLAQADRLSSMGMLAAGVAHEINNPLSYVLFNLESLSEILPARLDAMRRIEARLGNLVEPATLADVAGDSGDKLDAAALDDILARLSDALGGTQRICEITRSLGTFSRVEQDQLVAVNLEHVIEVALNMAHNEIKYRARLVKDLASTPTVLASEGRLSQVFLNLIINATHAITEGDLENNEIRVRTWVEGDEVCAEVRDTGSGIAPENLHKLFEPFFTTKKIGVGSGLGLAISKSIVESFDGTIQVSSEVGKGTSFIIRLPAGEEGVAALDTPPAATAFAATAGRILVIDDDPAIRFAISDVLSDHQTVEASSGAEAMKILQADQAFDVILCDMMMPDVTGVDMHEWLAERQPQLAKQLIFVTGGAFTPRARDYLSKLDNTIVEKPIGVAELRKIVDDRILAAKSANPR